MQNSYPLSRNTPLFLNNLKNYFQKILLIVCLLCGILNAEGMALSSKDSQWQGYFGVEGGVGAMSFFPAFLASFNGSIIRFNHSTFDWAYGGSVLGGWQKYTSDKVGMRHTLGFRVFVDPNTQALTKDKDKGKTTAEFSLYYALDGMFDFVKTDEDHRFGMTFGIGLDFVYSRVGQNDGGAWALGTIRMGLYTQFDNSILDLTLKLPAIGGGLGIVTYDTVATIGFKHLF